MRIERPKYSMDRLKICRECDRYNHTMRTCGECGCFMVLKTTFRNAECPLSKWGQVTEKEK